MLQRFVRLGAAAALGLLLATGCSRVEQGTTTTAGGTSGETINRQAPPHELRIGDNQDVSNLNPHLATATSLGNLNELTMAYLVRYDINNRPVPELATEVPTIANGGVSKDGLTITWHLRKDVKWSDGQPFDGDDVVFSTNTVNNPNNNEIGRDGWQLITKMDQPDKYTVVFHLKKPYSGYLPTFFGSAGANPCILPKHILGSLPDINHADYNNKPVGIGPYRYVKWVRSDHVELEANPYYWRGMPKIKKITYRFIPDRNTLLTQMQTGEIDIWPFVGNGFYDRVSAIGTVNVIHHPGYYYAHLDFNESHPLLKDKAVREAIRLSIDRKTIRDKIQHGLGVLQEGSETPVSPWHADIPAIPFDLAAANKKLDDDGWTRGPDGIRQKNGQKLQLIFSLPSGTSDTDQEVELMRSTWQQAGIGIEVRHYAPALFFGEYSQGGIIYAGKFDLTLFSWGQTPDGDLANTTECNQMPPNGQNDERYCNPATDALLAKEKAAYDEPDRAKVLADIQRQIVEDVPYIVLWIREDIHAHSKALTGWHPNASTPFDDFMDVDIK